MFPFPVANMLLWGLVATVAMTTILVDRKTAS